jgi:beta-glucanase (GH16 family)
VAALAISACDVGGSSSAADAGAAGAATSGGLASEGGATAASGASGGMAAVEPSAAGAVTPAGGTSGATSGGGSTASGAVSDGGNAGAAQGGAGSFTLAWQDDFNTLDSSSWELENFTYDGNEAQFAPQNASVTNGILTIALSNAAAGAAKPYVGVEMRSAKTLTYGKVSARMRFATGSGVVSGLVLFYTPYPNCDWNEIDIEHLGDSPMTSQFNAMVYLGAQVPTCTTSVTPTPDPLVSNLGFNAETDYHLYDIEWTPNGVNYIADGVVLRTWTKNIALLKRPLTVLLTIWASNAATWAGALTSTSAPTSADIDWIKVYDWNG